MEKPVLKKEIKGKLAEGFSKSEIYEGLKCRENVSDSDLRMILASVPAQNTEKAYIVLHKIISACWIVLALLEFLGGIELLDSFNLKLLVSIVITIYITVQILRFNGDLFLPAIIWLGLSVIGALKEYYATYAYDLDHELYQTMTYVYVTFALVVAALMYIVRKNVFGYYKWFKPGLNFKEEIMFENTGLH